MVQEYVKVMQNGEEFNIQPVTGKSLLAAAFEQEIPLDYKCQKGNCRRCRVEMITGKDRMNEPTEKEHEKIEEDLQEGFRLACQTFPLK